MKTRGGSRRNAGLPKSPDSVRRSVRKEVPAAVSVSDAASATTKGTRGVDPHILKQLLTDIEDPAFGGIDRLKNKDEGDGYILAWLLDQREEKGLSLIYGRRGDPIRTLLSKCATRWCACDRAKYLKLLSKEAFKVTPARATKAGPSSAKKGPPSAKKSSAKKPPKVVDSGEGYVSDLSFEGSFELSLTSDISSATRTQEQHFVSSGVDTNIKTMSSAKKGVAFPEAFDPRSGKGLPLGHCKFLVCLVTSWSAT